MGRRAKGSDEERLSLYYMGLTDAEMAEILGLSPVGVTGWRKKHKLPNIAKNLHPRPYRKESSVGYGVPMEKALPPEKIPTMRLFLALVAGGYKATRDKGVVTRIMRLYRKGGLQNAEPRTN